MAAVSETPQIELSSESRNEDEAKPINPSDTTELLLRSLDIVRLRAQIDQDHETYQKRPKRKFVGARTKEYRFCTLCRRLALEGRTHW